MVTKEEMQELFDDLKKELRMYSMILIKSLMI